VEAVKARGAPRRRRSPKPRTVNARRGPHDHDGETLLHVYWTHLPPNSNASAHLVMTNKVTCDLSMESSPDFTNEEMQAIMFAAKMAAARCIRERRKAAKP
jgi:hypothetical protein